MDEIGRKHPVHLEVHDRRDTPIIVYLTVCTKRRKPILANPAAHELLRASWREARLWLVGRYVIMPNHLHLFCTPAINYGGTSFVSSQTSLSEVANLGRHSGRPCQCAREMGRILEVAQCTTLAESGARPDLATSFLGYATAEGRKLQSEMALRRRESGACGPCEACVRLAIPRRDERAAVVFLNFGTTRRSSLHESAFRNCTFVE